MKKIFISYRRDDEPFATKYIYDKLATQFGKEDIFYDIGDIPRGADFREFIRQNLSGCRVAIAIIGKKWLTATGADGRPRLQDPNDIVRMELEEALAQNIPILPIIINDAPIPHVNQLPPSLHRIVDFNAQFVHPNEHFDDEIQEIINFLITNLSVPQSIVPHTIPVGKEPNVIDQLTSALGLRLMGAHLLSISMIDPNDGWIVGTKGTILRYTIRDGWVKIESPISQDLNQVQMLSPVSAWAVGDAGTILRYNGNGWIKVHSPTTNTLSSIEMDDPETGWAVGSLGTILRCQQGKWSSMKVPGEINFRCVKSVSRNEAIAVGASRSIFRFDGKDWKAVDRIDLDVISDLAVLPDGTIWAVGHHYPKAETREIPERSEPQGWLGRVKNLVKQAAIMSQHVVSSLMPEGRIYAYKQGTWIEIPIPHCGALNAIYMLSSTDGWAVGGGAMGGVTLHYSQGIWSNIHNPAINHIGAALHDVVAISPVKAWAVGGVGMILQFDWNVWKLHTSLPHQDDEDDGTSPAS